MNVDWLIAETSRTKFGKNGETTPVDTVKLIVALVMLVKKLILKYITGLLVIAIPQSVLATTWEVLLKD